ncbi:MAG: TlpA disulfide reductase family protein [Pseudomonadota bacterium]
MAAAVLEDERSMTLAARLGRVARWSLALALGVVAGCGDGGNPPPIAPGDRFPAIETLTLEGKPARLQPAADKVVVVNIWGTWCAPCRKELPSLQRLAEALGSQDYAVIGIALDHDDHLVREYLRERGIVFENHLAGDVTQTQGVLGVTAVPSTFILARGNVIAHTIIGPREWDGPEIIAMVREVAAQGGLEGVSK